MKHRSLASIRETEFARLQKTGHVYLDYTGAALYPSSLVDQHASQLTTSIFGNPHSSNPSSQLSTDFVDRTRLKILSFFNASPSEYEVVFTANASAATKLVAEAFPFRRSSTLLLVADNHNSVQGIREYARRARANVQYIPLTNELRCVNPFQYLCEPRMKTVANLSLFAFPAQSNFSGVQHPLDMIHLAKKLGWFVLLDAAAYVPSSILDLSKVSPDFVAVSFYKMFGYPTGIGALIVKKKAMSMLKQHRPWFAGGTVQFVSVRAQVHALHKDSAAFEDGTLNFTGIPAVHNGLEFLSRIGMNVIHNHVLSMTRSLLDTLTTMRWPNDERMARIYGPETDNMRGGTLAFDLLYEDGTRVDGRLVEREANKCNISLRVGCFCNPGAAEHAFQLEKFKIRTCLMKESNTFTLNTISNCMGLGYLGCIRASVGLCNNMQDVLAFSEFLNNFLRTPKSNIDEGLSTSLDPSRRTSVPAQRAMSN